MKIPTLYKHYIKNYKVTTDTRSNLTDSIFFALKGDNFNGNKYANEALKKGASFAVVDEKAYQTNEKIFLVDDVLTTLQDLARYHRNQLNIPVIALTGSNGKTTTKELIYAVLKEKYNCAATKGNLNNHIGVPLTLLSILPSAEIAVIEMGANHSGEIALLCDIANPNYGYITNFGKVHLEGFGSLEGVIQAKTEMYRYLKQNNKKVFINTEDAIQIKKSKGIDTITFGKPNSRYPVQFKNADPYVNVSFNDFLISSKLIGSYNYLNIATAITIGQYFDVPNAFIKKGIENYVPSNNRSQIIIKGSNKIILDAYNANPNSMDVAIKNLAQLSDKNKVVILGDMFEIGESNLEEHQIIANLVSKSDIQKAFLIGETFSKTKIRNENIVLLKNYEAFQKHFEKDTFQNTTILIKASRGMALERILDLL